MPCYFQITFTCRHGTFNKKWLQDCNSLVAEIHGLNFTGCAVQVPLIVLQGKVFEPITTEHAKSIFSCNAPTATFSWLRISGNANHGHLARGAWQKWVTMHVSNIAPYGPCLVEASTANSEQWTVGVVVLLKSRACSPCLQKSCHCQWFKDTRCQA